MLSQELGKMKRSWIMSSIIMIAVGIAIMLFMHNIPGIILGVIFIGFPLANILLITLSPVPRGILGLLLMGVCCFMMYREGEGMGERACSMNSFLMKAMEFCTDAEDRAAIT